MVMVNEDLPVKKGQHSSLVPSWVLECSDCDSDGDTLETAQSYDIPPADCPLRRRSNTAQRLERMKKEKKAQTKVKSIRWQDSTTILSGGFDHFDKKVTKEPHKPKTSALSEQLEKFAHLPANPFSEFAKFDGRDYTGAPTKKISIFLTMLHADDRAYPLNVTIIASARVQELIGLICWHYTNQNREPKLKENVEYYSLHIAEDDGEVDLDFPHLDPKELISKFGFTVLALVEKNASEYPLDEQTLVTVNIPQGGFSKIPVNSKDISMREILQMTIKRRKGMVKAKGLEYQLEKQNEVGMPVDLDSSLSSMDTLEFCLVRANSKRGDHVEEWQPKGPLIVMEAPLYQSYRVYHIHKRLFYKTEIHLGISGEKIEINPIQHPTILRKPQKPVTHDIENIAACEILDLKYTGKGTFRLTYKNGTNNDYKRHDFETESSVAQEVVQKINHILEMRCSTTRREYLNMKERKLQRKSSLKEKPS